MAARNDKGPRRNRLITDACSALKLLGIGEALFKKGVLKLGDLIIHPRFFQETKKWHKDDPRRTKYAEEFKLASKIRAEPNITADHDTQTIIGQTVRATKDHIGLSAGGADIEQLISCIHFELDLVTNDDGFSKLAIAFEVTTYTAEKILVEAISDAVITKNEAIAVLRKWKQNGEKAAKLEDERALIKCGIDCVRGFICD